MTSPIRAFARFAAVVVALCAAGLGIVLGPLAAVAPKTEPVQLHSVAPSTTLPAPSHVRMEDDRIRHYTPTTTTTTAPPPTTTTTARPRPTTTVPRRTATTQARAVAPASSGVEQWRDEVAALPGWNVNVMLSIMWCESKGDPNADNSQSTATGLFQILDGPLDPNANISLAHSMWSTRGTQPWVSSRSCWA